VTMKNAVFWDVALCKSCVNGRFGGTSVHTRSTRSQKTACSLEVSKNKHEEDYKVLFLLNSMFLNNVSFSDENFFFCYPQDSFTTLWMGRLRLPLWDTLVCIDVLIFGNY
jgi:hypothetical protein